MNKKATIMHHQGFGDLFTNNSLCNYYANLYDELIIFALDEPRKIVIEEMYKHKPNIKCVIPKLINQNIYNSSCLICMQSDHYSCRYDTKYDTHKFVDYSEWSDYDNIKVGCFKEDYELWKSFLGKNINNNISFSHSFYLFENLDLKVRETEFSVYRDDDSENKKYELSSLQSFQFANRIRKSRLFINANIFFNCTLRQLQFKIHFSCSKSR